jgi:PEP-CTERM motif
MSVCNREGVNGNEGSCSVNRMPAKRCGIAVLFVAVAFLCAGVAKADTVSLTLTGVSGGVQGDVYTSPYLATVGGNTNVAIICDDFTHDVFMNETWTANVSSFADLSGARFWKGTQAATVPFYDEAAFLTDKYILSGSSQSGDASFAVWAIFSPSQTIGAHGWDSGAATLLAEAKGQTFASGAYSDYQVLTPSDPSPTPPYPTSAQEFLVRTPEPSTLPLLCAGLIALVMIARRRNLAASAGG